VDAGRIFDALAGLDADALHGERDDTPPQEREAF
jgi:hypothetical protein